MTEIRAGTRSVRAGTGGRWWRAAAVAIAALACLPIVSLIAIALQGSTGLWPHLISYVLPVAARDTLALLVGVGFLSAALGTGAAWLVTAYDFPGRKVLDWALLLPLAVPTYIVAYAYLDLLHPVGPVQGLVRAILGYSSPREFRLPDIRSLAGCIVLLGLVLYPYVYLTVRAMFLAQSANLVEAARTLGCPQSRLFWRVALPLARPAIAVGVSLAMMEAINDVGASEFLGVRTLTVSIYSTWISRNDLPGAAQIALVMLAFVVAIVLFERWARRNQRYATGVQRPRAMQRRRLSGGRAAFALAAGSLPVALGFLAPAAYLLVEAIERYQFAGLSQRILAETLNTVAVSTVATAIILLCGFIVAYAARLSSATFGGTALRIASIGYAVPGTVLAIGLLTPIAMADGLISTATESLFGIAISWLILGSGGAIVYAYAVRFLAVSAGGIEAGFSRISPSLDHAARTLGQSASGAFRHVHLPLSRPTLVAAGLLVFVDCMKELPATLLLRPLNFETLATHLYGEAARGTYEEASIAALIIVAVGAIPVILLSRTGRLGGDARI